jgi:hypothetical protein
MLRIERILCPVDFSEPSARAYDSAQSLARQYQATLFLQHVVDFVLPAYAYYADAAFHDLSDDPVRSLLGVSRSRLKPP